MNSNKLEIWVLYNRPIDCPDGFVARKFINNEPTSEVIKSQDIDLIRWQLRDRGLVPMPKHKDDAISIVECWL